MQLLVLFNTAIFSSGALPLREPAVRAAIAQLRSSLDGTIAEPGDTIFVPEELNKTTFVQEAKDWTQILYNFGIGLAGIKSAVK